MVVALLVAVFSANAQWFNSLRPTGKPAGSIEVARDGKSRATIALAAQPTPQERRAAEELQRWLRDTTGTTLPIQTNTSRRSIVIRTDPALGNEGYEISFERGRLVLAGGKTRGVLNAVYALLEEDLGCRFYTKDSIRLPETERLTLQPVARRYIPRLKIHDPFYASAFDPEWSLRNRSNAPDAAVPEEAGGHADYDGMFVHTAAQMVPEAKYFKDHPDYFAQKADGTRHTAQLCATHPDVLKIAPAYVQQVLKDHPHTEIVSVSKNDNTEICHCPRCKTLREAEGSDMACQLMLVNHVADEVARTHPEVTIDTLAYLETIQVPKTARPRSNVAIRLCNDAVGSWAHPFTPARECDVAKLTSAWSAVHDRIYVWDYNVNFSHYLAPMPNLDVMADNIRFWITNHAEGVMLQGGYQGLAEADHLKCWVTAKLLWNPAWDERALTRDFIWGHYGKAAPAMEEYERLLERMRREFAKEMATPAGGIRYPMDAPFLNREFITKAMEIFTRAHQAAIGDAALLNRVERAELPILYVQCVRGPEFTGADYGRVVAEFERIARREGVKYLAEGGQDFDKKLAEYKARIPRGQAK